MGWLQTLILVVHVLAAIAICGFVLLQHGKGADMGAAFGGGTSGSLFGASGSANFLSRTTGILAALFFATSVGLTWFASQHNAPVGVMEKAAAEQRAAPAPARPVPAGAADVKGAAAQVPGNGQVPGSAAAGAGGSEGSTAASVQGKAPAGEVPK